MLFFAAPHQARYTVLGVFDYGVEKAPFLSKLPTSQQWDVTEAQARAENNGAAVDCRDLRGITGGRRLP